MKANQFLTIALVCLSTSQLGLFASCRLRNSDPEPGHNKTETRDVKDFSGIKASTGIKVLLSMTGSENVQVTAGENIIKNVKTEVEGGILHIYYRSNGSNIFGWNHGHNSITVTVKAKHIESIDADSGSELIGETPINQSHLKLHSSSGASLRVNVSSESLELDASSGSATHLSGKASHCTGSASSGASIKASELQTDSSRLDVSSGANITMTVTKSLDAHASSGGSIDYKGSPASVSKDKSSGGSIDSN